MKQRRLGAAGLEVSTLGLSTRTWGLDTDARDAAEMLATFLSAGGTLVDLVDDPSYPEPGEVLGELLEAGLPRGDVQLLVRSGGLPGSLPDQAHPGADSPAASRKGAGGHGSSRLQPDRRNLLSSLETTLARLGTDYVDIWMIGGPLGDVPLSEVLSAVDWAYASGRARYVGLSDFSWWSGGRLTGSAASRHSEISAWGAEFSLLRPGLLNSAATALARDGLGIIAGAPLAGGVLTGKYRHTTPPDSRATSPRFKGEIAARNIPAQVGVVDAAVRAAEGLDRSAAQVALAWVLGSPGISSAVVGPRSVRQLEHLLETADWQLPAPLQNVLTDVALSGS